LVAAAIAIRKLVDQGVVLIFRKLRRHISPTSSEGI
jgi:hypothetical protein